MDNINFPEWYASSTGPKISQTIFNIVGSFLPVINMLLANKGVNLLPETVNFWVSIGVFCWFSVRAAYGYIRARKVLGEKIMRLQSKIDTLEASR